MEVWVDHPDGKEKTGYETLPNYASSVLLHLNYFENNGSQRGQRSVAFYLWLLLLLGHLNFQCCPNPSMP